jgi:DNA-binding XRE family transcriptional regulator
MASKLLSLKDRIDKSCKLKLLRKRYGLSIKDASKMLGVQEITLKRMEGGVEFIPFKEEDLSSIFLDIN